MDLDPFELHTNAIWSAETREKYQCWHRIFFDFVQFSDVSFEERCRLFLKNSIDSKLCINELFQVRLIPKIYTMKWNSFVRGPTEKKN